MRGRSRTLGAISFAVVSCLASAASGQDAPAPDDGPRELGASPVVRVSVRENATPFREGDPVADAWVAVVQQGEGPQSAQSHALATDAEGVVEIEVDPDGAMLLIWKNGRAPQAVWVSGSSPGTIVLQPGDPVVAQIDRSTGRAAAHATLTADVSLRVLGSPPASDSVQRMRYETRADEHGLAQIDDLPAASLVLRAEADGWVPAELFPVEPGGPTIALTLVRGALVSGRVRAVPGGAPLAGAHISLGGRSTISDDDGTFELRAIPPGSHELVVTASDHLQTEVPRLVLTGDDERSGLLISLTKTSGITGRVVNAQGDPVAECMLTLHWPATDELTASETFDLSDAPTDRPFEVTGLLPGDGVVVEVRAPGYAPLTMSPVSLVPGETAGPLDIVLDRGVGIVGRVVDASGVGVSGAIVDARSIGDSGERPAAASAVTSGDGAFQLDGVPWGAVRLDVYPPPDQPVQPAVFQPLRGSPDRPTDVGSLALTTGHVLRGSVEGAPGDATVEIIDLSGRRFSAPLVGGAFEVSGLAPGEARVRVARADGAGGVEERISLPTSWPLELTWRGATRVRVGVVGLTGGATARLRAVAVDTEAERDGAAGLRDDVPAVESETDRDGVAELTLTPGTWRVSATAHGMTGTAEMYLDGVSEQVPLQITLAHGEMVRGEVSSAHTGAMIEGARVVVRRADESGLPIYATTEMRGGFIARGVAPGFVLVEVRADGHAPFLSRPQTVQRGAVLDVGRIELEAGAELRGELRLGAGVPLRGKRISLTLPSGAVLRLQTDLQGRFRADGLPPGPAVVEIDGRRQQVELPQSGEVVDVVIDLTEGTVVTGTVTTDGRAVAFAEVEGWTGGAGAVAVASHCDAYGRFELPPVSPGTLWLEVTAPGAADPFSVEIVVPDVAIHDVQVELPAGKIIGEVRTEEAPAAGALVWVWDLDPDGAPLRVVNRGAADGEGRFEIAGLPDGGYVVEARRRGSGGGWSLPVDVVTGGTVPDVSVRLQEEARVRVLVVDDAGEPVAGGWLQVTEAHDGRTRVRLRAHAGMSGLVELSGLTPGPHDVVVGAPGRGSISIGRFDLRRGVLDLDRIRLAEGGALEVEVVHPGYAPAAGIEIRIEDLYGRDPRGRRPDQRPVETNPAVSLWTTDRDGVAYIPDLAPGVYVVGLADGDAETTLFTVTVRSGEVAEMLLWAPWVRSLVD